MFRLNRLTDYGVVVLTQMSRKPGDLRTAPQISQETGVPLPTVAKLLNALAHGRLIESHRGASGGYTLERPAEEISVAEIIQALEGPIALTACVEGSDGDCDVDLADFGRFQEARTGPPQACCLWSAQCLDAALSLVVPSRLTRTVIVGCLAVVMVYPSACRTWRTTSPDG